jgi:hypothetical protein
VLQPPLQVASQPALPLLLQLVLEWASQVASADESPQPTDDAPSADRPVANASNISPRAKMVFLLAVIFVSFWDCRRTDVCKSVRMDTLLTNGSAGVIDIPRKIDLHGNVALNHPDSHLQRGGA